MLRNTGNPVKAFHNLCVCLVFYSNTFQDINSNTFSDIKQLRPEDQYLDLGSLGNFSIAGFEMVLTRYVSTYIITYYLPSGTGWPKNIFLKLI